MYKKQRYGAKKIRYLLLAILGGSSALFLNMLPCLMSDCLSELIPAPTKSDWLPKCCTGSVFSILDGRNDDLWYDHANCWGTAFSRCRIYKNQKSLIAIPASAFIWLLSWKYRTGTIWIFDGLYDGIFFLAEQWPSWISNLTLCGEQYLCSL